MFRIIPVQVAFLLNSMTTKQKLAASKLVENGGNIGGAMVAAGYSPATAKTPKKLTKSKGWSELMKEVLPDDSLVHIHSLLLNSYKIEIRVFPNTESDLIIRKVVRQITGSKVLLIERTEKNTVCHIALPDNLARLRALEMAYKVKNRYMDKKPLFGEEQDEAIEEAIAHIRSILPRSMP